MASFVLKDAFVKIAGVDLSNHVKQVTVNYSAELKDKTAMNMAGRAKLPGLLDYSLDIQLFQDFANASVDQTVFSLVGTQCNFEVRPTSANASVTNPKYTGNGVVESYQPVAGTVGDEALTAVKIMGGDGAALARGTS